MNLKSVLAGIAIGAIGAASVTAWAAIPDSRNGEITVCRNGSGALRAIDAESGQRCQRAERTLTFGQRGATGPQGATGPSNGTQRLVVVDATSAQIGTFVTMGSGGGLVVLGDDGNFRVFATDGSYGKRTDGAFFTTDDCSGDRYSSAENIGGDPFRMITRFETWQSGVLVDTADLIESLMTSDLVTGNEIRSAVGGEFGGCYPFAGSSEERYIKMITPSFLVGTPVPPLKIVEAP